MLASNIEDFTKLWPSKRPSKFHRFPHRFFIDLGSVLASNMGPSWGPRRLKIRKNGPQKKGRCLPKSILRWLCFWTSFKTVLPSIFGGSGLDFPRCLADFSRFLAYFGPVFGCSCWASFSLFLVRSSANFAKQIQELAEDKAENKIRTNASKKTQISKLCSSKLLSLSQTSLLQNRSAAVLPPGGLQ